MDGEHGRGLLILCGCLLAVGASGCADSKASWNPFAAKVEERIAGIPPPYERIAALRKTAKEAPGTTPEQKQQIVADLSNQIRNEKDSLMRLEIIRTLGEFRVAEALPVLRAAVDDPDADVRVATCEAWGKRGDAEAA